jgi:hypothetical protein
MASYVTITDTQVDPQAPITSDLMSALRDNPIAIAERAAGAPRVNVCERTLIYSGGSVQTVESSDFETGYYYRFIFDEVGQDGSNGAHYLAMDFMRQSNSTWVGSFNSSYLPVGYVNTSTNSTNGTVTIFAPRITANHFSVSANIDKTTSSTTTFTSGAGATSAYSMGGRVYVGSATQIKRVRFWMTDPITGHRNMLTGNIYQEKLNLDV